MRARARYTQHVAGEMNKLEQPASAGEATFAIHCQAFNLSPEREFRFHPGRRWRIDFAFPEHKIAVEIEGGIWSGGRHVRGSGYSKDLEKYNMLALNGWRLLRFSPQMVNSGMAIDTVREILSAPNNHAFLT